MERESATTTKLGQRTAVSFAVIACVAVALTTVAISVLAAALIFEGFSAHRVVLGGTGRYRYSVGEV